MLSFKSLPFLVLESKSDFMVLDQTLIKYAQGLLYREDELAATEVCSSLGLDKLQCYCLIQELVNPKF